jgi:hypothetical protein
LIPYVPLKGHKDPDFKELSYGDSCQRGETLKNNLSNGSYLFFHTKIGSAKYITCFIAVEKIVSGKDAQSDESIKCDGQYDDWLFIGNKDNSKRLRKPIPFNRVIAEKLSLRINFDSLDKGERSELQVIGSSTRSHRQLSEDDVSELLEAINSYQENTKIINPEEVQYHLTFYDEGEDIIPFDEIHQIKETEIQKLLRKNPNVIEEGAKVIDYEKVLSDGDRLDLLLEAKDGSLIVAELKGPDSVSDEIATQVASYVRDIQKEYPDKKVRKMIICDGKVSPKLQKACEALQIEIVVYGLKIDCFKL